MIVDLHMHSHHSRCAQRENNVQTMVDAAIAAGLEGIAITDHLHPHIDPAILADNRNQLAQLKETKLEVWIGVELDVLNWEGDLTGDPELYKSLDYVMAGIHHYHVNWVDGPDLSQSPVEILAFAQQNLMNTIPNPWLDAIGHPWTGVVKVLNFNFYNLIKPEWIEEAGYAARNHQTALEIPAWAMFKDDAINEDYLQHVVRPLIKTGCPLVTATDAHSLSNIGKNINRLTKLLLEEGATEEQLWSPAKRVKTRV
ncbi:PHP domain-containing protein [Paenibacillus mendelii]|uniref:PHP domain-containing protein n=1 Tax=Paenibacillus mendelii TaxID=206163 RepID=A0ABV6J2D1_9BACL|nr:PHP domain-containing protein [Paenibacillus mendelii]MCQ6563319.1 PHP domain-containing protein [Paenibacillus mendelii]